MRDRRVVLMLLACVIMTAGSASGADERATCQISPFRGATRPGGALAKITVVNVGEPCRITNYTVPEAKIPTTSLRVVTEPANGTVTIEQPNVIHYTPRAGFVGSDRFSYEGHGVARSSTVPFAVTVDVTVVAQTSK